MLLMEENLFWIRSLPSLTVVGEFTDKSEQPNGTTSPSLPTLYLQTLVDRRVSSEKRRLVHEGHSYNLLKTLIFSVEV